MWSPTNGSNNDISYDSSSGSVWRFDDWSSPLNYAANYDHRLPYAHVETLL